MMATTPFIWGAGGEKLTPEQVKRLRENSQHKSDFSPVGHWTQGAARLFDAWGDYRGNVIANEAETAGMSSADDYIQNNPVLASLIGSGGSGVSMGVPQGASVPMDAMQSTGGGLPASLVHSESGGNWNALNSEGYGGRGQFGEARLADAARAGIIPAGMTGESYSQAPEDVQLAVENWHRADILGDLGKYVGVDVDGPGPIPPLTADSILSVAHLGGTGGARRFIESGGRYNPSDSNGTSLADYATRHAGGASAGGGGYSGSAQPQNNAGVIQALTGAMSDPWVAKKYGPVLEALMGQQMKRGDMQYQQQLQEQDPYRQLQMQRAQLELDQMRNPSAPAPVVVGGVLVDPSTGQEIYDSRLPETPSPMSGIAKLQSDLNAGLIDQSQYDIALANMAPPGMSIESDGDGGFRMVQGPGAGMGGKPPSERQSSLALFGNLMDETMPEIAALEADPNFNPASLSEGIANSSGWLGNYLRSEEGQRYQALQRQWAEGVLRIQTGAAATEDEINRVMATYFPQPGDSKATLVQKSQQRDAFARSLGPASGGSILAPGGAGGRGGVGSDPSQPSPNSPGGQVDFTADTPPPSLDEGDADLWQYATPEERQAIWGQ